MRVLLAEDALVLGSVAQARATAQAAARVQRRPALTAARPPQTSAADASAPMLRDARPMLPAVAAAEEHLLTPLDASLRDSLVRCDALCARAALTPALRHADGRGGAVRGRGARLRAGVRVAAASCHAGVRRRRGCQSARASALWRSNTWRRPARGGAAPRGRGTHGGGYRRQECCAAAARRRRRQQSAARRAACAAGSGRRCSRRHAHAHAEHPGHLEQHAAKSRRRANRTNRDTRV